MTRRLFTTQERAYIAANKDHAEDALKDLIEDLNYVRSKIASYAVAFDGVRQFIDEAIATIDEDARLKKLENIREVCVNHSSTTWLDLKTIRTIANLVENTRC
jgi:hypothetical protein